MAVAFRNNRVKDMKLVSPKKLNGTITGGYNQREKVLTTKPWLEGTEENGMTLSIAFSPNVHRRFSTHVSFESKRNRAVYERIMRAIGEEPIKKR